MNPPALEIDSTNPYLRAFQILAQIARDRSRIYRWLALGFYPPDEALLGALASGQLQATLLASSAWLGSDQARLVGSISRLSTCASISLANLEREYYSLFGLGIEAIPPHESEYRWRDPFHLAAAADRLQRSLCQLYQGYGLVPLAKMEDHLAVELEFLAYQCESEAAHWSSGSSKAARELRRQERAFLDDHLGRWLPEFCLRVQEKNASLFYQILASLCDGWLALDQGPGYLAMVDQG